MESKTRLDATAWFEESFALAKHDVYLDGKLQGVCHWGRGDFPADTPKLPSDYEEKRRS